MEQLESCYPEAPASQGDKGFTPLHGACNWKICIPQTCSVWVIKKSSGSVHPRQGKNAPTPPLEALRVKDWIGEMPLWLDRQNTAWSSESVESIWYLVQECSKVLVLNHDSGTTTP